MYVTLKNGQKLRMPTDEEDAAITAAAMSDPDARPLTDEEWERVKPFVRIGARPVCRPKAAGPRPRVTLRMDADVVQVFKNTGPADTPA